jgi:hypothetical protein
MVVMKNNLYKVKHLYNSHTNFIIQTMKFKITFARLYVKYLSIYSCAVEPPLSVPHFTIFHFLMFKFKDPNSVPSTVKFIFLSLVSKSSVSKTNFKTGSAV